LIVVRILSDFC